MIMTTTELNAKTAANKDWNMLLKMTEIIKSKEVREFTLDFLDKKVPDYFARVAASATGKYHPEYALGFGGLIRHSMAVTAVAASIVNLEYLQFNRMDKDLIIAACLLHDSFKQGLTESGNTIRTHPNVAAREIAKHGKETGHEHVANIIAALVLAHMGEWGNQKPGNKGQFIVHLADFIASRKFIDIDWLDVIPEESPSETK